MSDSSQDREIAGYIERLDALFECTDGFSAVRVERQIERTVDRLGDEGMARMLKELLRQTEAWDVEPERWIVGWPGALGAIGLWLAKDVGEYPDLLEWVVTPRQFAALVKIANGIAWYGANAPMWWTADLLPHLKEKECLRHIAVITVDQISEKWNDPTSVELNRTVKLAGLAPESFFS